MISLFGGISVAVAAVSVAIILLHNRVMSRRSPVDEYLYELEEALRQRADLLYDISAPDTELRALLDEYADRDFAHLLYAMPYIEDALAEENPETDAAAQDVLDKTARAVDENMAALDKAIEKYNAFITTRRIEGLMAKVLGLTVEEPIYCHSGLDKPAPDLDPGESPSLGLSSDSEASNQPEGIPDQVRDDEEV